MLALILKATGLSRAAALAIGAGAIIAAIVATGWIVVDAIGDRREAKVVETITHRNTEARDAADKARQDHDSDCARGQPGCLSDAWTRDR
ncbi:hypothetical protein [Microcystis phage vB_MweS-yong2]|nr:hypothetical protein [Microcystis phage vB_MweS-yong2]